MRLEILYEVKLRNRILEFSYVVSGGPGGCYGCMCKFHLGYIAVNFYFRHKKREVLFYEFADGRIILKIRGHVEINSTVETEALQVGNKTENGGMTAGTRSHFRYNPIQDLFLVVFMFLILFLIERDRIVVYDKSVKSDDVVLRRYSRLIALFCALNRFF